MECYEIQVTIDKGNNKKNLKEMQLMTIIREVDYSNKHLILIITNDGRKFRVETMNIENINLFKKVSVPEEMKIRVENILLIWGIKKQTKSNTSKKKKELK